MCRTALGKFGSCHTAWKLRRRMQQALSCLCLAKRDLNPAEDPQGAATTGWVSGAAFEAEWHAKAISRP